MAAFVIVLRDSIYIMAAPSVPLNPHQSQNFLNESLVRTELMNIRFKRHGSKNGNGCSMINQMIKHFVIHV